MNVELTQGPIFRRLIRFALPLMLGNLLQQLYNVADTLIVGRFVGSDALAAVGSAYTLMTFLTSVLLGLSMGSGAVFSIRYGEGDQEGLKAGIFHSFLLIGAVAAVSEFHCLPFYRSHYGPSSGSFRCISPYERVSLDHICRDPGCFSVQLFCLPAAGRGKFCHAPDFFWRFPLS